MIFEIPVMFAICTFLYIICKYLDGQIVVPSYVDNGFLVFCIGLTIYVLYILHIKLTVKNVLIFF